MKPKNKKPLPAALDFAMGGAEHREQEHIPRVEPARKAKETPRRQGGRPKSFDCETERIPVLLPTELAHKLKLAALNRKMTPSQIVAELLERL